MAILSYNNPRNRTAIIATLLIVEFMAILWLKDSSPASRDTHVRRSLYNPGSSHDRYQVHDDLYYRQQSLHNDPIDDMQSIQYGNNIGNGEVPHRVNTPKYGVHQDPKVDIQSRVGSEAESGGIINEESGSHNAGQPMMDQQQKIENNGELNNSKNNNNNNNKQKSSSSKSIKISSKSNTKNVKKQKSTKSKNSKKQHHHHRSQQRARTMNQRGGFKSTEERKLAQLIPAMDENGVVIEDHFISPKDTDGDGIPDTFILFRPSANSDYMMDVGLFDDVIAASTNAPAPVPVSSSSGPATAAVPVAPSVRSVDSPSVNVAAPASNPNQ